MWNELLAREYFGNSVALYLKALVIVLAGLLILLIAGRILKKRIEKLEERQRQQENVSVLFRSLPILKLFHRIVLPLLFLGVLGTATTLFNFDSQVRKVVSGVFATIMTIVIIRSINRAIDISLSRYFEREREKNKDHEKNIRPLLSLIKFIFWVVGFIFLLANLGFDVSTAVAGLGVSGIAVAIAAQGILGDLFSYFVIFFDKPFELGDFIIFGDKLGAVEKIGIKSSRIRALSGELLIISNSDLVSSRIHNYKQMKRRRVAFTVGVTYQTTQEHVEEIPGIMRSVVESVTSVEGVICDRAHFKGFGDFSLNFETVYYVPSADYVIYMDVQQEISQNVYRIFNEKGIEFAYPTQTIHFPEDQQLPKIALETRTSPPVKAES